MMKILFLGGACFVLGVAAVGGVGWGGGKRV
jgi:hypothetical protein